MPTYGKQNFKQSNVNYLNKVFASLKNTLINYAKSYFPNTYRDFNETSPGMMLLEMNAYVGDVLSFYIDQQYKEMLLPLAEERRNIITMAKMFGYKVKPIVPAYVDLTFTSNVAASSGDASKVNYNDGGVFDPNIQVQSSTNESVIFTTLEPIDFQISASNDTDVIGDTNTDSGIASTYTLSRTVKAISATEKTIKFQIGIPEKFKTLTIPDKDVIDIISCVDSNGQSWYEVDYLAQDKVPIETHYTNDINRDSAYSDAEGGLQSNAAVPYTLNYEVTTKRFTKETNLDNTTSLVFGNGVLKDGQVVDDSYIDTQQLGVIIPGVTNNLNDSVSPLLGDEYSTLGETPNNTTLTITYRVGGGLKSNVASGDLTTTVSNIGTITPAKGSSTLLSVTNDFAAIGGKDEEDIIEIKEQAKLFFSTQNRCVTKEDYEARVLNLPSKFGNIAKVFVTRISQANLNPVQLSEEAVDYFKVLNDTTFPQIIETFISYVESGNTGAMNTYIQSDVNPTLEGFEAATNQLQTVLDQTYTDEGFPTINIYVLGYDNIKRLVGNPFATQLLPSTESDAVPLLLKQNIKTYLQNFKILTDTVTINDGFIVNFGVFFDVIAEKYADKQKVKLDCIEKIREYFRIEKMQFNQPIYKSELEFELMGVEGVRSIGHVTITQEGDYFYGDGEFFDPPLYTYTYNNGSPQVTDNLGYGYKYDFQTNLSDDGTIVLPPIIDTPAVFELKNPNQNIQGRVR